MQRAEHNVSCHLCQTPVHHSYNSKLMVLTCWVTFLGFSFCIQQNQKLALVARNEEHPFLLCYLTVSQSDREKLKPGSQILRGRVVVQFQSVDNTWRCLVRSLFIFDLSIQCAVTPDQY